MVSAPTLWLADHRHLLPRTGLALDIACGHGRHAFWLAAHGFTVSAIDRDANAVEFVNAEARRRGVAVDAEVVDLEAGDPKMGMSCFDVVVAVNYLHRPLFPHLIAALRPEGVLVYETFTREQALRGKPSNPAFLLDHGELRRLVAPLSIVAERECEDSGRFIASVIARKIT